MAKSIFYYFCAIVHYFKTFAQNVKYFCTTWAIILCMLKCVRVQWAIMQMEAESKYTNKV